MELRTTLLKKEERGLFFKIFQILSCYFYISILYDKEQNVINICLYKDDKGNCIGFNLTRKMDRVQLWATVLTEMGRLDLKTEFPDLTEAAHKALEEAQKELEEISGSETK
jgi:hypothetical protein